MAHHENRRPVRLRSTSRTVRYDTRGGVWTSPTSRRQARAGLGILVVAVLGLLGLVGSSVFAATNFHDPSVFELDGNAVTQGGGDDWDKIAAGTDSALASTGLIVDRISPHDQTYFWTGGSKDTEDVTDWKWGKGGGIPDKQEITNAYAAAYAHDGKLFLYYGMDRYANDGDATIGFWFFQDRVELGPDTGSQNSFMGEHQVGDVLVLADFTNGGAKATVDVYQWVGSGGSDGSLDKLASGALCKDADANSKVCAVTNDGPVPAPWDYTPKSGPAGTFPTFSFFEGGVDLTALFPEPGCFASFMAVTRSSHSLTARLHDFALGQLGVCDARIQIDPQKDVNQVGDAHGFTVTVDKQDQTTGYTMGPASGATVTASIESGPGAFEGSNTCVTAADGTCEVTVNSSDPGVTIVSASADVGVNGETIAVSTNGEGHNSGPALKEWVDARIRLTPPKDANQVDDTHTFTAFLEFQHHKDGPWSKAPAGETITFAQLDGPGSLSPSSCSTDTDGRCSITHTSAEVGVTTVQASWTGSITTGNGTTTASTTSPNAIKRWVDAQLSLTPSPDANRVNDTHTFTAHLQFDLGDSAGWVNAPAGETINASKVSGPGTLTDSNCTTAAGGTCTVVLNSTEVGVTEVQATWTGQIATADGNAATAATSPNAIKRWVDAQLSLTPSPDANQVNDTHTFTAHLQFDLGDGTGWINAPAGETINASKVSGPGTLTTSNCTTNASGRCTIDLDSDAVGVTTVRATWNGGIVTTDGTASATTTSNDAIKRWVDARLRVTPEIDVNPVDTDHTFTAHLELDLGDGAGWVDAPDGESITFAIADGPGGFVAGNSCATTGGEGRCTIDITSAVTGITKVTAAWSGDIVTGDGTAAASATSNEASKRWANARLSLTPPEDTNEVGDTHTFTAHLELDHGDGAGFVDAPAGETIDFEIVSGPGTRVADSCLTAGNGRCSLDLQSAVTGLTRVSASWMETGATVASTAQDEAVKRWVKADLGITPSEDTNEVGDPHTFTVHLRFDYGDGNGFLDAPAGETVTLNKLSAPGELADAGCTTATNGQCTVVLTSAETGLTEVRAAWSGSIGTVEGTATASAQSPVAIKRWVKADLGITPPEDTNQVGDPHTFTVHLRFDYGDGFVDAPAGETVAVTKQSGPGGLAADSCVTESNGRCSVDLGSLQTGLSTVNAAWSGEIGTAEGTTTASAQSPDAVKRWVDARLHITPEDDTNHLARTHTFTAILELDLGTGAGFAAAPAGETITFSKVSGPGGFVGSPSCTTGANGTCAIDLVSSEIGVTVVAASWTGQISTAEGTANAQTTSNEAIKRWVDAQIAINPPQATNQVNDPHVFTIFVGQKSSSGPTDFVPAPNVVATTQILSGPGAFVNGVNTCTTAAGGASAGTCTVTVDSAQTGLTTVSASANVVVEGETVPVATDGSAGNAAPGQKRWVDARLAVTPLTDANQVGDEHEFTAQLQFDLGAGAGFVNAGAGETILFEEVSGPGTLRTTSCNTGSNGQCSVVMDSAETGISVVSASWTGQITTAEGTANAQTTSNEATKRWVDGLLVVTPTEATNVVGDPHTYTGHLQFDLGDGAGLVDAGAREVLTFAKVSGPGDFIDGVNTCTTAAGGQCTVDLVSSEVGTTVVAAAWTGTISTAEGQAAAATSSGPANKLWVQPAITIVKTADPDVGPPRDVTYTYLVTNIGDVTLSPVRVTDDILGDIGEIPSLAPGESATLSRTEPVDAQTPVRNVGTACGDPVVDGEVIGAEVCAEDDAVISVVLGTIVTLPRTGGDIHLHLLMTGLLMWIGAAAMSLHARLVIRRRRIT